MAPLVSDRSRGICCHERHGRRYGTVAPIESHPPGGDRGFILIKKGDEKDAGACVAECGREDGRVHDRRPRAARDRHALLAFSEHVELRSHGADTFTRRRGGFAVHGPAQGDRRIHELRHGATGTALHATQHENTEHKDQE